LDSSQRCSADGAHRQSPADLFHHLAVQAEVVFHTMDHPSGYAAIHSVAASAEAKKLPRTQTSPRTSSILSGRTRDTTAPDGSALRTRSGVSSTVTSWPTGR